MKLSYNQATARDCSSLEKDVILCEKEGFDYIEIRLDMLDEYLKDHTVRELAQFFQTHRLKPHALNALYLYGEMYSEQDEDRKREALESRFLNACETGRQIGSRYFIIVPPLSETVYTKPFDETKANCVRILRRLSELSRPYGINLCFELVGLRKSSVCSIAEAREIVEEVNRENVGYVFDSYNLFTNGGDNSFEALKTVPVNKIFAVHINNADDCAADDMAQDKRRFCDQGIIRLDRFLNALKETGYDGMVSIETFRPEYWRMEPEEVIHLAYRTTRDTLEKNGCL